MIDLRRIRIGVEIGGQLQLYEGLRVRASGVKHADALQNECTISLNGLNTRTRNYLLTEASPYNENRKPKRVTVEVGRQNSGIYLIYVGDITSVEVGSPPDMELTIRAKTNNYNSGKVVVFNAGPMAKLSEISERVANDNELRLEFQATDKNIANFSFSGPASRQVSRLAEAGGIRAYVDDRTLYVKDLGTPATDRRRILNLNSGMVGIPQATEQGVEVSYLIDGESDLGGQLTLESLMNESLNGDYIIEQLRFEATSHDDPFFYTALCGRMNQ